MIQYEILKPREESPVGFNLNPPINLHNAPLPVRPSVEKAVPWEPLGMGKLQYADWLNHHIYPHYYKGKKVTLRSMPFVVGKLPEMYFIIKEIQEIHYMVQLDRDVKQPKALGLVVPHAVSDIPIYYPPALIRPLYPEEEEAFDKLRDQTVQRIATVDAYGEPIIVDVESREIK